MFAIVDIRTINTIFVRWHSSVSFVELSEFTFCPCTFYSFAHTHVVSSNSDIVQVPNIVSFVELRISSNSDIVQYFINWLIFGQSGRSATIPDVRLLFGHNIHDPTRRTGSRISPWIFVCALYSLIGRHSVTHRVECSNRAMNGRWN